MAACVPAIAAIQKFVKMGKKKLLEVDMEYGRIDAGRSYCIDAEIRAGRDRVVVFFPHRWATRKAAADSYGAAFARKYNLSALLVRVASPNWFQGGDFPEFAHALAEVCRKFDNVVFTGSSMGAYGAIRAAETVPADRVIAFSPISNIDPDVFPYETGYVADFRSGSQFHVPRDHRARAYSVFFDSLHKDKLHADNFYLPERRTSRYPIACGGHNTAAVLADAQILSDVTLRLIEGRDISDQMRRLRHQKRSQPTYLLSLFRRTVRRRPDIAVRVVIAMREEGHFPDRLHRFERQLPSHFRARLEAERSQYASHTDLKGAPTAVHHLLPPACAARNGMTS